MEPAAERQRSRADWRCQPGRRRAAFGHGQVLAIVAASLAGVALIVLLVDLTFDFDSSARAHATCSAHLWGLRERYRALLSDLHDGALDLPMRGSAATS